MEKSVRERFGFAPDTPILVIVGTLQEAMEGMTKRDAVEHLHSLFPHRTETWYCHNFQYLMALDPAGLVDFVGHPDPTAETAIRNVLKDLGKARHGEDGTS